jgi:hypothetical protein
MVSAIPTGAGATDVFDFLYIEGNVGGASGGHVAVRFGDEVFHYQNAEGAQLRLVREDFEFFRHTYSVLQNRTIHLSRLDVADETYDRLSERFHARHLIEQAHFDQLAWQRRDAALIARITEVQREDAAGAPHAPPARARGVGLFRRGSGDERNQPRLVALQDRIAAAQGVDYLQRRRMQIGEQLRLLRPGMSPAAVAPPSKDRLPASTESFSRRFSELAEQWLALDILASAPPLRREVLRTDAVPAVALGEEERETLRAFADRLERNLTALVASDRPDWGYPLLVGMARLEALDQTLRSGRLVVLDAYAEDAPTLRGYVGESREAYLREVRDFTRTRLGEAAVAFFGVEANEAAYSALEDSLNRALEVQGGLEEGHPVRVSAGQLVPQGEGDVPDALLPEADGTDFGEALALARERGDATASALDEAYGYDLLHRNCVSEIFATFAATYEPQELAERLGGTVGADARFAFIPFVASRSVRNSYRIAAVGEIPSYRRTRLAEMYASENPMAVYLRETSTLTSSVYRPNPQDSFFLFFTDDTPWPRPVFGVLNLLAGLGETVTGIFRLPFDGGGSLWSGAKGAFFSLPELAFINVRKGSLEYGRTETPRTQLRQAPRPAP